VRQALADLTIPSVYASASDPGLRDRAWLDAQIESPHGLLAMEVGSGRRKPSLPGLAAFNRAYPKARVLLAGAEGMPLADLLRVPAHELVAATAR